MRSPFRVLKRKNTAGKIYYQVRFLDVSGKVIKSKSYPDARSVAQACRMAEQDLNVGIVPSSTDPLALVYCEEFWSEDSPYFKSQALRGKPLSESYRQNGHYTIKKFEPYLKRLRMSELTAEGLEEFADSLAESGVNPRSINLGLDAVKRPYAVFCKKNHLPNVLLSVEHHAEKPKERGILTTDELSRIVNIEGEERAKLAVLLAALCGLRRGEVRALRYEDIDFQKGIINVCRNIVNNDEGLKEPKCGSSRTVPAPDPVLNAIEAVKAVYPEGLYVVPNLASPDKPCDSVTIRRGFLRIMKAIGISEAEMERRNLVYHGLRHTFVSLSQSIGLPDFIVARLSGHKGMDMVRRYTHADGLIDFASAKAKMEYAVKPVTKSV